MKNKLLIDVSIEDHNLVESVCVNSGHTFESFFKHLIDLYKKSLNDSDLKIQEDVKDRFKKPKKKIIND